MSMKRNEFLKLLAKHRNDDIVLTCWQSINAWEQLSPCKFNFQSVRTMGECSTFGLGLALARTDKRVIILEGDGSLCMNLASLITIAMAKPSNLYQFILHNKMYETTGGQTIPNVDNLDLTRIACGAGIYNVHSYDNISTLKQELPTLLKEDGPVFILVNIEPDDSHVSGKDFEIVRRHDRDCNKRFREALAQ